MERQFRINWPAIVEEAKQRRKSQKLTQQRLGALAGVSTPTISRFEGGERDIQLSTVTNILRVLGMLDERVLIFPEAGAHYDPARMAVVFKGRDADKIIACAISHEALADHFSAGDKDKLKVFKANRERIEHEARRKYLAGRVGPDGSVLIETMDL
jgi:transcriptional regulator with XRE-family HTH domain